MFVGRKKSVFCQTGWPVGRCGCCHRCRRHPIGRQHDVHVSWIWHRVLDADKCPCFRVSVGPRAHANEARSAHHKSQKNFSGSSQLFSCLFLQHDDGVDRTKGVIQVALGGHWLQGKHKTSPALREYVNAMPNWTFVLSWTSTYENWVFWWTSPPGNSSEHLQS